MTKAHKLDGSAAQDRSATSLVCSKCGHANERRRNTCGECGAHLHIVCHECGHRNERVASECVECGKRLHRSLWRRLGKKLFRHNPTVGALQVVLFIVVVYLAYKIITKLVEIRPLNFQ